MAASLCIWRLTDGRRGHDSQSLGLLEALGRLVPVHQVELAARSGISGALRSLRRVQADGVPALVVGAGHATHPGLIVAARRHRARSVVLMNPTLPRRLFDLCVLPIHDGVTEGGNVMLSLGALNRILPSDRRDARAALILVGGPSKHHGWSQTGILEQVRAITASAPQRSWVVAGSPRTPTETVHALRGFARVQTLAFEETDADWLPGRLADAGTVWVTEDSVSMAYEAASSGAAVGLLDVPTRRQGRVHAAVKALREEGYATTMSDWRGGMELRAPDPPLQEAARCAEALLARWPELA